MAEYTGSRVELVRLLDSDDEQLMDGLCGWQFAAVARALAEAGAVHPKVHTPTRIMQWLEKHGWERVHTDTFTVGWKRPQEGGHEWFAYTPVDPETTDYAHHALGAMGKIAWIEKVPLAQVLAEVAALPDGWV